MHRSPVKVHFHLKFTINLFLQGKNNHFHKYFSLLYSKMSQALFFFICLIVTIVSKVGSQYIHELWIKLMKNACSCKEIKKWLKLNIFLDVAVFIWPEVLCTSSTITNFVFLISIVLIFIIFKTENFKNA